MLQLTVIIIVGSCADQRRPQMSCFVRTAQIFSLLSLRPSGWSPESLFQHHLWSSDSLCCLQVQLWFDIHNAPQNIYAINHQYICAVLIVKLGKPPPSLLNKPCVSNFSFLDSNCLCSPPAGGRGAWEASGPGPGSGRGREEQHVAGFDPRGAGG